MLETELYSILSKDGNMTLHLQDVITLFKVIKVGNCL